MVFVFLFHFSSSSRELEIFVMNISSKYAEDFYFLGCCVLFSNGLEEKVVLQFFGVYVCAR